MTDRNSYSRFATELLAGAEPVVGNPSPDERNRAVELIAQAIVAQARARRRRRVGFGVLAAAASIALLVSARTIVSGRPTGVVAHGSNGVTVSHGGTTQPLHDGAELARGDRVHVEKGATASLALSTGTHVEVDGGSDLTLLSQDGDQVFGVESGATRFVVAKVAPGKRFIVRTADVEVEVRGTAFRVAYGEPLCEGSSTRVVVTEGLVVVRQGGQEALVPAGGHWPVGCETKVATVPAASTTPAPLLPSVPTVTHPSVKATSVAAVPVATVVKAPGSDLAEQNDLFAEATSKKRNGDRAGAVLAYERLLSRWPASALAETAAIERMRLLAGTARHDAAKAYLARWPNGSARSEAESLLGK